MKEDKTYKKIKKTDLSVSIVFVIGIVAVLNYFSSQLFLRWDLTQNKVYSISEVSKKTVKNLDDIVTIKAYFSKSLPSQVLSVKQEVEDILDEYQTFSNGHLRVELIDPSSDEKTQKELYMIGIPQLTFEVYEKDKRQLVNGYMGIAISYADKVEVIPAVKRETMDLEYQLTTAIKKVIADEIATIGYLSSNGTSALDEKMTLAKQELESLYTVKKVDLEVDKKIADEIDTLLIVGPTKKFSEDELKSINDFVIRGGSLMVLVDGVVIGANLSTEKNGTGLEKILKSYGITINQDLVADLRSGTASFSQGYITFSTKYPFWPLVLEDGFNKQYGAVANLENVLLPWASSLDVEQGLYDSGVATKLAYTSEKGWQIKDSFNINPQQTVTPQGAQKVIDMAVTIKGEVNNPYPDKTKKNERINGRIVVVGDSDFIGDGFVQNNPDNLTFFQNLVDSLSFDEDLISIRSKTASSRPISDDISVGALAAIRYVNVFGITAVVVIYGMLRYFLRRRSRFADDI
jgi:gliding-associated putative ABC transporter substrate-binding component GldG